MVTRPRQATFVIVPLLLTVLWLTPHITLADDLGRAREAFVNSSAAADEALLRALGTATPEARPALERALQEVRSAKERTLTELSAAGEAAGASQEGPARAREAVDRGTQTHLRVLQDALGQVPPQAQPAIERALEVSRTGRTTALQALQGGVPPQASGTHRPGPPAGVPPSWGHSGPPGGIPGPGIGGPPAGIPRGGPRGAPGR